MMMIALTPRFCPILLPGVLMASINKMASCNVFILVLQSSLTCLHAKAVDFHTASSNNEFICSLYMSSATLGFLQELSSVER
jgi:hypothetical protein